MKTIVIDKNTPLNGNANAKCTVEQLQFELLNSSNGHQWQTTNQEFIKKTVKVMHEAILTKIAEVETEIELIQIA